MIQIEKGLSLDRLQTLCLVVRAGSIAAAAVGDLTRQSQYSRQLKELEAAVGKKLVKRDGKLLKATQAGIDLAGATGTFLSSLEEIARPDEVNRFILAASDSVLRHLVIPRSNHIEGKGTALSLRTLRTNECLEALRIGGIDLAIVRADAISDDLVSQPVGELQFCWVVPRKCLPGRTAAGIYDASSLPFGIISGDGRLAKQIREIGSKNRINLDVRVELETFSLLLESVKTEEVAAVLPIPAAESLPADRFTRLEDEEFQMPPRPFVLSALKKAHDLRPALRRIFDQIARAVATTR